MPHLVLELPPDELRANRRSGGHRGKMAVKDKYMEDCQKQAMTQARQWKGVPVRWPTPLLAIFFLPARKRLDPSDGGFWAKAAIDSLVQMGVFPDDSNAYIRPFITDVGRDADAPRLELYWGDDAAEWEMAEISRALAHNERFVRVSRRKA